MNESNPIEINPHIKLLVTPAVTYGSSLLGNVMNHAKDFARMTPEKIFDDLRRIAKINFEVFRSKKLTLPHGFQPSLCFVVHRQVVVCSLLFPVAAGGAILLEPDRTAALSIIKNQMGKCWN